MSSSNSHYCSMKWDGKHTHLPSPTSILSPSPPPAYIKGGGRENRRKGGSKADKRPSSHPLSPNPATADQHLLLAILATHRITVDHIRVSALLGCSPRACEERLKKLRKTAKEAGHEFTPTPAPAQTAAAGSSTSRSERKRRRSFNSLIGGETRTEAEERGVGAEVHDLLDDGGGESDVPLIRKHRGRKKEKGRGRGEAGFVRTRAGVDIPLGVPLEIASQPLVAWDGGEEEPGGRFVNEGIEMGIVGESEEGAEVLFLDDTFAGEIGDERFG
jgi:hypothetical protein